MRALLAAISLVLAVSVPALARAQRLAGASRAVRSPGSISAPRVSASGGARGGAAGSPRAPVPRAGGASAPRAPSSRWGSAAHDGPGAVAGSEGPQSAPTRSVSPGPPHAHRPRRLGWSWVGGAWVPPAVPVAARADAPAPALPPARRDDFAGGGGVTATAPIGLAALPPRAAPMIARPLASTRLVPPPPRERVRARVGLDAQLVIPSAARLSVWGVIELPAEVDLVVGYDGYGEPRPGGFDALAIGRLGVAWRFASEGWMRGRIGVSGRHFQDWLGARFGVEARLGLEIAIADEVVIAAEGAVGTLGSAWALAARATIEADLDGIRLYAGYDHLALQPFDASQVGAELGGPIVGVSVPIE